MRHILQTSRWSFRKSPKGFWAYACTEEDLEFGDPTYFLPVLGVSPGRHFRVVVGGHGGTQLYQGFDQEQAREIHDSYNAWVEIPFPQQESFRAELVASQEETLPTDVFSVVSVEGRALVVRGRDQSPTCLLFCGENLPLLEEETTGDILACNGSRNAAIVLLAPGRRVVFGSVGKEIRLSWDGNRVSRREFFPRPLEQEVRNSEVNSSQR